MNIRQVEVFKAIMEAGSITGAANLLGRSQPAISKHLGLMEDAIGLMLFTRTGNRLMPTEEAMRLFEQVERTYLGIDHLSRFASNLRNSQQRELTVAAMPLLARSWLADVIASFSKANDYSSLSLPVRSSRWIIESVSIGHADIGLALSMDDDPAVGYERVMRLPLVCVFPQHHRFADLSVVLPEQLEGETLISLSNFDQWRLTVENALDASSVKPSRRIDSFTTFVACELASRDAGIAIVDSLTARDYTGASLTWRPFLPALHFDINILWSKYRRHSQLTRELLAALSAAADKTQQDIDRWLSNVPTAASKPARTVSEP